MNRFIIINLLILTNTIFFSRAFKCESLDSLFRVSEKNNKFMGTIAVSQNGKLLYSNTIDYSEVENYKKATVKTNYRIDSVSIIFTASLKSN